MCLVWKNRSQKRVQDDDDLAKTFANDLKKIERDLYLTVLYGHVNFQWK